MRQTQSEWLGMLSDLQSTLWELKASFSGNVKASSSCILFSPCSAWGSTLCSVQETDFNPSRLNPSFTPCQPQQANEQKTWRNKRGIHRRERAMEMLCAEIIARKRSSLHGGCEQWIPPGRIEDPTQHIKSKLRCDKEGPVISKGRWLLHDQMTVRGYLSVPPTPFPPDLNGRLLIALRQEFTGPGEMVQYLKALAILRDEPHSISCNRLTIHSHLWLQFQVN